MVIPAFIGSILFGLTVILYLSLVFGAPLGEYAMGGQHSILPFRKRIIAVFAIIIQLSGIIVLLDGGEIIKTGLSASVIKIGCYIYAIYLSLNVLMNIFSKSKKERMFMTPLSFVVAICFWIVALQL